MMPSETPLPAQGGNTNPSVPEVTSAQAPVFSIIEGDIVLT